MGSPCPTNLTVFTDSTLTTQTNEKAVHITELKAAINRERTRRGYALYFAATGTTQKVSAEDFNAIVAGINSMQSLVSTTVNTATKGQLALLNTLRTNINNLEGQCLCNCNYCACNCNYCACNCNYCSCNCNYCNNCCNCGCNNCHDNHCVNCGPNC